MSEVKKIATRESYGNALVELGKEHEDLVVLDADLAAATKTGMLKLVKGSEFDVSKRTVAATKLADGDSIIAIRTADNFNQLVLQTENGY